MGNRVIPFTFDFYVNGRKLYVAFNVLMVVLVRGSFNQMTAGYNSVALFNALSH